MKTLDLFRIRDFISLARLNRPIGIYLLFWPTMWALWLAAAGERPGDHNLLVFTLGAILMRSAGCVINDYADRHFDGQVKRTCSRPLVTGRLTEKEALLFFVGLIFISFLLVLTTNLQTIALSFIALFLAAFYPFAKRYTHWPQLVLGAAFSWAIPMAYTAETGSLASETWLLFIANLLWTVAYDTQYAMVDRDDDLRIGIKSTAVLFGQWDNTIITCLQILMLIALAAVGLQTGLTIWFYLALSGAALLFAYQRFLTGSRKRDACFKAFLSNHWVGALIFAGILLGQ